MSLLKVNSLVLSLLICWSALCSGIYHTVTLQDWENYKSEFNKIYPPGSTPGEAYARYYFNYNVGMIRNHNAYADRGQRTYRLKENQFTDMRLITFNAMFPTVQQPAISNDVMIPPLQDAPLSFNPITMFGQVVAVQNQGIACNSGWAYAAAKAIELMAAVQTGNLSPAELSAQNLIDCAGRSTACKSQVPQAAFDFLTQYAQDLHTVDDYPNDLNATEANMCLIPPMAAMMVVNLRSYGRIKNNDDVTLMKAVGAGYPVVVEFNPTSFDFMHYSSGIFQVASTSTVQGAHHLIVLGYDTDAATGLDYWLCLNSFDTTWGEGGFIRIARDSTRTIFRNAIFPLELA